MFIFENKAILWKYIEIIALGKVYNSTFINSLVLLNTLSLHEKYVDVK